MREVGYDFGGVERWFDDAELGCADGAPIVLFVGWPLQAPTRSTTTAEVNRRACTPCGMLVTGDLPSLAFLADDPSHGRVGFLQRISGCLTPSDATMAW